MEKIKKLLALLIAGVIITLTLTPAFASQSRPRSKEREAPTILKDGKEINKLLKELSGDEDASEETANSNIEAVLFCETIPNDATTIDLSDDGKIKAWYFSAD